MFYVWSVSFPKEKWDMYYILCCLISENSFVSISIHPSLPLLFYSSGVFVHEETAFCVIFFFFCEYVL